MKRKFVRRDFLAASAAASAAIVLPSLARAQALEKRKVTIAVGGKNLLYYLPLTIFRRRIACAAGGGRR